MLIFGLYFLIIYTLITILDTIKHNQLLNICSWYEPISVCELIAPHLIDIMSWALRYEYVCLIMMYIYLWYASQNTHANRAVLAFLHIVSEILVGWGSHQHVQTDHPIVRSLMLIAFWFSDELYLLNSCYDLFEKLLARISSRFDIILLFAILSRMCILDIIYSLSCWTHSLIIYHFQGRSLLAGHFCPTLGTCYFGCIRYFCSYV